jgi:hypothetical protein
MTLDQCIIHYKFYKELLTFCKNWQKTAAWSPENLVPRPDEYVVRQTLEQHPNYQVCIVSPVGRESFSLALWFDDLHVYLLNDIEVF